MWKGSAPPESPDHDLEIEEILDNESVVSILPLLLKAVLGRRLHPQSFL
jgi:hypothetical protein